MHRCIKHPLPFTAPPRLHRRDVLTVRPAHRGLSPPRTAGNLQQKAAGGMLASLKGALGMLGTGGEVSSETVLNLFPVQ